MDEPTVGIDPQARSNILEVVRDIAASGTTVLYTTHYLEEAETLCDRIGIMDHGKILAEGTLDELKRMLGEEEIVTVTRRVRRPTRAATTGAIEPAHDRSASTTRPAGALAPAATAAARSSCCRRFSAATLDVDGVSIQPPSLNGLFLKLTGRELRD